MTSGTVNGYAKPSKIDGSENPIRAPLMKKLSANNPFAKCTATNLVADGSKLEYDR